MSRMLEFNDNHSDVPLTVIQNIATRGHCDSMYECNFTDCGPRFMPSIVAQVNGKLAKLISKPVLSKRNSFVHFI